ncbi:MAG: hypothetical protein ACYDBJ_27135 [Aggregatilineales bacterium]
MPTLKQWRSALIVGGPLLALPVILLGVAFVAIPAEADRGKGRTLRACAKSIDGRLSASPPGVKTHRLTLNPLKLDFRHFEQKRGR